jgi:ABC-2 type transport system ATP-binding protein
MSNNTLIQVDHLYRYYGDTCAVNDVSFTMQRGEVVGLLGPNGAGKTSTMQIISGNLAPSAGKVSIDGIDILDNPKQAKERLGYLPEQPPLYRELTVDEYLGFCAQLNRIPRNDSKAVVDRAKERCGLGDVGKRLIGNLSKGYQQRVGIAQAILHTPPLIILDEPTVGLDPIQILEIRDLIRELSADHSVILSTHILPEVQATCDRVLIINRGSIALADTLEGLGQRMQSTSLIMAARQDLDVNRMSNIDGVTQVEKLENGRYRLHHNSGDSPAEQVARMAAEQDWGLYELSPERVTLEQVFIDITCKEDSAA